MIFKMDNWCPHERVQRGKFICTSDKIQGEKKLCSCMKDIIWKNNTSEKNDFQRRLYLNSLSFKISTGSIPIGFAMGASRDLGGLFRLGSFLGGCFASCTCCANASWTSFFWAAAAKLLASMALPGVAFASSICWEVAALPPALTENLKETLLDLH